MVNSPARKKAKTEASPPDMSALHAPPSKGWSKSEWTEWSNGLDKKVKEMRRDDPNFDFIAFIDQRNNAMEWAAPEQITVKISIEEAAAAVEPHEKNNDENKKSDTTKVYTNMHEVVLSKQGADSFRSIIDKYCKEENIERDNYLWSHKGRAYHHHPLDQSLMNQTDTECFFKFWHFHPPTLISRFVDENTFLPEIVGRRKKSPAPKPSVPPSFERLKSPPPDGNAKREEWDKWHKNNNFGCVDFWREKNKAVEYMCPDFIDVVLKGLSHEHTVKVKADDPLSVALSAYCTSTTGTNFAVNESDVILRVNDGYIDVQMTSARMRFNGYSPLKFDVVYRDTHRTEAELESIRGPTPEGYEQLLGSGFLLSDTEQPWYISTKHGVGMYNKIGTALDLYEGMDYKQGYDPEQSWFAMTGKVKSVLGGMVRKPRGGWSVESAAKALDGLTAALLNLTCNDDWCRDALGKIMFANPACRKESVSVLRKMDSCAISAIKAANDFTAVTETPAQNGAGTRGFSLERALGQLKRLMQKYNDEYEGFAQNGHDYRGYNPFSKALLLID